MAASTNSTTFTVHGSYLLSTSDVFCCAECGAAVAYVILPGGEYAYECSAPTCGKTIHEDCVQGLAVRDELAIELPAPAAPALVPPGAHHFQEGEAVYYTGRQSWGKPFAPVPAVIVRAPRRIRYLDTGKEATPHHDSLVYRGYCAACAVPAHTNGRALYCPLCGADAVDCPPPDALIVRWFPLGQAYGPMTAYRAATHPEQAWNVAHKQARAAIDAIDYGIPTFAARLGLEPRRPRYAPNTNWDAETTPYYAMRFHAYFRNEAAYRDAYRALEAAQQVQPLPNDRELLLAALDRLIEVTDSLPPTRPRPAAPVLRVVRSADDSQPDGADATTAWLEQQFNRAA